MAEAVSVLGLLATAISMIDIVYKTTQKLKRSLDRKGQGHISSNLARLEDLVEMHSNILTTTSNRTVIEQIEVIVSSVVPQLRQVESWMLQPSKRLNRLFKREPSWAHEQDAVEEVLKKTIETLVQSLKRYPPYHSLAKGSRPASIDAGTDANYLTFSRYVRNRRRQELFDWLSDDDAESKQNELCRLQVKGTGGWLNDSPDYQKWHEGSKRGQMWCFGSPGSGKSVLMSQAIAQLQNEEQTKHSKIAVIYYYFDFRARSTTRKAVASLLRQLCHYQIPLPSFLCMRWDEHQKAQRENARDLQPKVKMTLVELVADFISLLPRFERVYVCLDGLDECCDLFHHLIPTLKRFISAPCQMLLTSRHLPELNNLMTCPHSEIRIEDFNTSDIKMFLEDSWQKHPELSPVMNQDLALEVSKQLTHRSHGNFLAVQLQFNELSRQTTTYQLKQSLKDLPVELKDTYVLLLSSIDDQPLPKKELAKRTLQWLAYSRRPLSLSELQQAVSIDPKDSQVATDPEQKPSPLLISEVCKDLIEVDIEQNKVLAKHASLAHYLQRFRHTLFEDRPNYIASSIISFLRNKHLSGPVPDTEEQYNTRMKILPFSAYASQYWGHHLAEDPSERSKKQIQIILRNKTLLQSISQILNVSKGVRVPNCPSDFGAIHLAAYFGLDESIPDLLRELKKYSMSDSWGRNPLHIACLRVPADRGSSCHSASPEEIDHLDDYPSLPTYGSGLQETFDTHTGNFLNVVDHLASNTRISVNGQDNRGKTPLHYAVMRGSIQVARLLLHKYVCSSLIPDTDGYDPLYYAAEAGSFELVQLLLEAGFPTPNGRALCVAASNGHVEIVEKLLGSGYDYHEDEALFLAARNGFPDIVTRLYRQGANQTYKDNNGMGALHHAAHAGHAEITEYLVMEGADINELDGLGRSPLLLASENGDLSTIELLIKRGAVVDTVDGAGNTALDNAAANGHPQVVRYLLRHGARTNSDGLQQPYNHPTNGNATIRLTPLQIAGKSGFDAVAQVLLDESSSPDKTGNTNRTPLSYAAEAGHESMVKLLLSTHRVNVNFRDNSGRTPLSYASEAGYFDIMKLLLSERGVDVNCWDEKGRTPLSYAAEMGHVTAVLLLLVQPIMIATIPDDSGLSPRDYAEKEGHSQVVEALDNKNFVVNNSSRDKSHKVERRTMKV